MDAKVERAEMRGGHDKRRQVGTVAFALEIDVHCLDVAWAPQSGQRRPCDPSARPLARFLSDRLPLPRQLREKRFRLFARTNIEEGGG